MSSNKDFKLWEVFIRSDRGLDHKHAVSYTHLTPPTKA